MTTRSRLLEFCLQEGVRLLREQDGVMPPEAPAMPPVDQQAAMPPPADQQTPPAGGAVGADGQPLTVDKMIEKLNVIRGGKSFSDPEVYGKLTSQFKQLPDPDKVTLDRVLGEIGVSVEDNKEGQQPEAPTGAPQQPPAPPQAPPAPVAPMP